MTRKAAARGWTWAAGLPAALLAAFCGYAWPLALPGFVGHDADRLFLFYPALAFARGELLAGRIPLWNPFKLMGAPFLANLMVPVFYPPQFVGLLAPQPFGENMTLLFHALLAAGLAWGCARRGLKTSRAGAAMAAITFAGSAPMFVALTHYNQFYAMAWLPGVLWTALRLGEKNWLRGATILGAVMGLQGLAGQPQISLYGGVIVFCATLFAARDGWRSFARAVFAAALGGALAFWLAGVHLIPGLELSHFSLRQMAGEDYAVSFSLPGQALTGLLAPGLAPKEGGGEVLIFFGQLALALTPLGFLAGWRKSAAWLLAAVAATGLVMALGGNTTIYPLLLKLVPVLQDFRAPARAFILCVLSGAMLAGMGLDWLRARVRARAGNGTRMAKRVAGALLVLQFGALAWNRVVDMPQPFDTTYPLEEYGLTAVPKQPVASRTFRLMTEAEYLDVSPGSVREKIWKLQADANILAGDPDVFGYVEGSLPTAHFTRWVQYYWYNIYTAWPDANLLGLMGVRCIMADKPVGGKMLKRAPSLEAAVERGLLAPQEGKRPDLAAAVRAGEIGIFVNEAYRGLVFTRADWPDVDFASLNAYADIGGPRIRREILKETLPAGKATPVPAPHLQWSQTAPGAYHVRLLDPGVREVLLSTTVMPGWEAVLPAGNGKAGVERIAGHPIAACLMAFDLPAGATEFEIVYRPRSFRMGVAASLASLTLLLGIVAIKWKKQRRKKRTGNQSQDVAAFSA